MARRGRVARKRKQPVRTRWWEHPQRALMALLVVLLCAATVWLIAQTGAAGQGNSAAAPPTRIATTPTSLPAPPMASPVELAAAERLKMPSTTGMPLALSDFKGKKVVLDFYAEST